MSINKIVVLFTTPAGNHWAPRLRAGSPGLTVEVAPPPRIIEGDLDQVPKIDKGTVYLVNAAVGSIFASHGANKRDDIYVLPIGAPQNDTPVGLDFLVKI